MTNTTQIPASEVERWEKEAEQYAQENYIPGWEYSGAKLAHIAGAKSEYLRRERWVSVTERLPEVDEMVQCFFEYEQRLNISAPVGRSQTIGCLTRHRSWSTQAGYMIAIKSIKVTHWQPLPEPPSEP